MRAFLAPNVTRDRPCVDPVALRCHPLATGFDHTHDQRTALVVGWVITPLELRPESKEDADSVQSDGGSRRLCRLEGAAELKGFIPESGP